MQQDPNLLALIELNDQLRENLNILNQQIVILKRIIEAQQSSISPRAVARQKVEDARRAEEARIAEEARRAEARIAEEQGQNLFAKMKFTRSSSSSSSSGSDSEWGKKYLKYKNKYQKLKKYM